MKGKAYNLYFADDTTVQVLDMLSTRRGLISKIITEFINDNAESILDRYLTEQKDITKTIKRASRNIVTEKKEKKRILEQEYRVYCDRIKNSPFELDHQSNLIWIEKKAKRVCIDAEELLARYEERYKKEGKK